MDIRKSEKIFSYLDKVQQRHAELSRQLSGLEPGRNQRQFVELAKELSQLKPLAEKFRHLSRLRQRIGETEELLQNSDDGEMRQLAEEELHALHAEKQDLENEVFRLMVTDTTLASRNVFLEIRAGTGGDEASLFATDLLRLYLRIAEKKKWQSEIISSANSGVGGLKEVIIYLKGKDVYNFLQFERGVHRVQRVPVTEASGRIHTSTVTVAILPEIDDVSVEINPKDIRIDTYTASGHGGQHVNKTESAIRITHFPSGIVVTCQDEKSQHKNKDKAMKVLRARLYEFEKEKRNEDIARNRKQQVGSGDRSEKIRTYNFPQNRVTDHRLNGRNFPIDFIMAGDIDDLIAELEKQHSDALIEKKIAAVCQ